MCSIDADHAAWSRALCSPVRGSSRNPGPSSAIGGSKSSGTKDGSVMAAAYRCVDSSAMTVALGLFAAVGWAFVTLRLASVSRGLDPAVGMFVLLGGSRC